MGKVDLVLIKNKVVYATNSVVNTLLNSGETDITFQSWFPCVLFLYYSSMLCKLDNYSVDGSWTYIMSKTYLLCHLMCIILIQFAEMSEEATLINYA